MQFLMGNVRRKCRNVPEFISHIYFRTVPTMHCINAQFTYFMEIFFIQTELIVPLLNFKVIFKLHQYLPLQSFQLIQ